MKDKTSFTSRLLLLDFRWSIHDRDNALYKHLDPVRVGLHHLIVGQIVEDTDEA